MFEYHASQRDARPKEISVSQATPLVQARPEKRTVIECLNSAMRNCGKGKNLETYLKQEVARGDADANRTLNAIASDFPKTPRPRPTYSGPPMDEAIASAITAFHKSSTPRRIK